MRKRMSPVLILLAAHAAAAGFLPAHAEESELPGMTTPSATAGSATGTPTATVTPERDVSAALPTPARSQPLRGRLLDSGALAGRRGGTGVLSDMKLSGVVADNRAINTTSGANLISDGAFSNTSGMPVVIQNSGSNVLIQNATIVNVQVN